MLLCLENQASHAAVWGGPVTTSLQHPKHGLATGFCRGGESGTFSSPWCHLGHPRNLSRPSGVWKMPKVTWTMSGRPRTPTKHDSPASLSGCRWMSSP